VIDDLIDLILRSELAPRAVVARLAAGLAPLTVSPKQLLGLGPRLGAASCRVFGGSQDGGLELLREFCLSFSSSRSIRASSRATWRSECAVSSTTNSTHASRPDS
jgi:hypothetical protein